MLKRALGYEYDETTFERFKNPVTGETKMVETKRVTIWYIGAGVGIHDKDWYVPISLQRNFSKNSAVEVQLHCDPHKQFVNGGQILYKRAVNKLFYFF